VGRGSEGGCGIKKTAGKKGFVDRQKKEKEKKNRARKKKNNVMVGKRDSIREKE